MKSPLLKLRFWESLGIAIVIVLTCVPASNAEFARGTNPQPAEAGQCGIASYYADKYDGRPTASGEIFDMNKLTAAHRTLPFGTVVKVTNLDNHQSVTVRINDRGPFIEGRVIDLSLAAARQLDMVEQGLAHVTIEIVR